MKKIKIVVEILLVSIVMLVPACQKNEAKNLAIEETTYRWHNGIRYAFSLFNKASLSDRLDLSIRLAFSHKMNENTWQYEQKHGQVRCQTIIVAKLYEKA